MGQMTQFGIVIKKVIRLSIIFSLFFTSASVSADKLLQSIEPEMRFHHFGPEQGLTSQVVNGVARDSMGFVWIASLEGLYRFDGYRFQHFIHDPDDTNSLSGNRLRSLVVDRKNRIWVGTESNGVTMYDPATHTFRRFGNDPQDQENYFAGQSLFIKELSDGSMAFLVFGDGMAHLLPDLDKMVRYRAAPFDETSLSSNLCLAADIDPEGQLWVACLGGSLQRFDPALGIFNSYRNVFDTEVDVPLDHVSVLLFDKLGGIWMGTDGLGLIRKEPDSKLLQHIPPDSKDFALAPDFVTRIMEDDLGSIWIGYRDAGIDVLDWPTGLVRRIEYTAGRQSSLSSNNTFALTQDDDGLVWVPTWGAGLNVTRPANTDVVIYESALMAPGAFASNSTIRMQLELKDGRLLITSRDKKPTLFRRDGHTLILDKTLDLVPGDDNPFWIITAMQGADGRLWIPTVGRGLYVYDLQQDVATMVPGTEGWNLVSIFEDSTGTIWTSEFARGVFTVDPNSLVLTSANKKLNGVSAANLGPVLDIEESPSNVIWMGTRSGLYRLSPDRRTLTRMSSATSDDDQDRMRSARGLTIDTSGRLWVAGEPISYTANPDAAEPTFIFPFDNSRFSRVSANNVVEDGSGRLWFTLPEGLLGYDPKTGVANLLDESFDAPTNAPDGGVERTSLGELVIAGLRRLAFVSPEIFDRQTTIRAPEITRLVVGGEEVYGARVVNEEKKVTDDSSARITITPQARDFTVEYASINPLAAASYTYAHKLEGFDRDWIYTDGTRRSATYTNLSPGAYTLRLNVFDRNGQSSPLPSIVNVEVLPAFHQTLWFRLLTVALVCLALFVLYQARLAVLKANQRKLERQIYERTEKIEQQKSELAEHNVKIESTMTELKETQNKLIQSEKLAALGGLVAGVAHEVNTPIGLVVSGASQIQGEVNSIKEKLDSEVMTKTDLQHFLQIGEELGRLTLNNAQKAADLIKSFKLVSADQVSQKVTRIQLVDYLRNVAMSIKPLLIESGHSAKVEGDESLTVSINAGALSQVITNLVTNAVNHAFPDGKPGEILINVRHEKNEIAISVRDNGCGIPARDQDKIFDPFFTTSRGKGNTGLGLHIVHNHIVSALKGTITISQPSEGGSEFLIILPSETLEH